MAKHVHSAIAGGGPGRTPEIVKGAKSKGLSLPQTGEDENPVDVIKRLFNAQAAKLWSDESLDVATLAARMKDLRNKMLDAISTLEGMTIEPSEEDMRPDEQPTITASHDATPPRPTAMSRAAYKAQMRQLRAMEKRLFALSAEDRRRRSGVPEPNPLLADAERRAQEARAARR